MVGATEASSSSSSSPTALTVKNPLAAPAQIPTPDISRNDLHETPSDEQANPNMPRLTDFELIRVLGKGCAGRVLLVKHTPSARVHAMKAISKRAVLANDELDHTLAEQDILRHFAIPERRNAFVSRLYYSFCDKENFYLVMEFYPGGDLATQMEIHGILGPLRTRFYTCDIVAGLEALHREGILVRDLKPENILLNWHGHAVLADFGLSKNFGYRGDPVPVKLPADYIEGKGTPPAYAGKGFGSYRNGELTWDRAHSFVGTQEYLAPEVIKRNHYTYAIDWWALGCIVCECLTGRVPFRGHEDESNAQLYDRVINSAWDAMYRGDRPVSYLKERYRIDSITYDFIDGLLQKEPMFRLAEPSVMSHPYFTNVDWETVAKGDYQDPFQLEIDPVAEYNTQFFPRLCLEETPSVDMSGHDYGKDSENEQNALNSDDIYAKLQKQFAEQLGAFEWTCDDYEVLEETDDVSEAMADDGVSDAAADDGISAEPMESTIVYEKVANGVNGGLTSRDISTPDISHDDAQQLEASQDDLERVETPVENGVAVVHDSATAKAPIEPPVVPPAPVLPEPVSEAADLVQKSAPLDVERNALPEVSPAQPVAEPTSTPAAPITPKPTPVATKASSTKKAPSIETKPPTSPLSPRPPSIVLPPPSEVTTPPARPVATPSVEVDDIEEMAAEFAMSPQASPSKKPRIPSGLPSSGLSVSDVISVPSATSGQNIIIRRHRPLPSIDSYRHARLSVDLNGTFGQLGDEDWEQLDANTIPEMPNGANESGRASLFVRGLGGMLGRRQVSGGSRRTSTFRAPSGRSKPRTSGSDTSSDRSPSKARPPLARGFENTRRALTKIKAFPAPAPKANGSDATTTSGGSSSASSFMPPPQNAQSPPAASAPLRSASHTLGMRDKKSLHPGDAARANSKIASLSSPSSKRASSARSTDIHLLFSRPKTRRPKSGDQPVPVSRSSLDSNTTGDSTPATTAPTSSSSSAPRIELNPTPPIAWGQVLGKAD